MDGCHESTWKRSCCRSTSVDISWSEAGVAGQPPSKRSPFASNALAPSIPRSGGHARGYQTSAPEFRRTGPDGRECLALGCCSSCFGRPFRILSLAPLVKGRKGGCCESEGYLETHGWFCQEISSGRSPERGDRGSGKVPLAQDNDATQEGIR
jgi:hypothetical protein